MSDLVQLRDVLWRYFATELPNEFLRDLVDSCEELAAAVQDGSIGEPEGRELLIDALRRRLRLSTWPRQKDTSNYRNLFYKMYRDAVVVAGGTFAYSGTAPAEPPALRGPAPRFARQVPEAPSALDILDGNELDPGR